jgi:uncharacterized protein (TIGR02246 family)
MSTTSHSTATTDDFTLRQALERTSDAWAIGDADAFAAVFTTGANVVIAGTYLLGRDAVRSYVSAAFAGPFHGTRVVIDPVYVKHLGPDLVLIVTEGGVLMPGESQAAPQFAIRGTWLLARTGAEWQVEAYHSSTMATS